MTIAETRPFRTPSAGSVHAEFSLVSPATSAAKVCEEWSPGDDIVLRGSATLTPDFWVDTGIDPEEEVWLVGIANCVPSRARWRTQSRFVRFGDVWAAAVEVTAKGSDLAVALAADLWIVGPGRTGSANPAHAIHHSAKLWQMPDPLSIPLEREGSDFPTSAVSFSATGRRAVPWSVEVLPEAEAHWSISSAIRLYVNTDLEVCEQIVEGRADEALYAAIECDIHLAVLHQLGGWRETVRGDALRELAAADFGCLAALGVSIAVSLGLRIEEACRLAIEEPLTLSSRSREAVSYYSNAGG